MPISNIILASGSTDETIRIWNIEDRLFMSTLSGHTRRVDVLCSVSEGVLVSGSLDNSLIIWSKLLTGHKSNIKGIIRLNKTEIISGEWKGDLMMWNIAEGFCIRHIPNVSGIDCLDQMKQHIGGDVVVSYRFHKVGMGAANNWGEDPIKQFDNVCEGCSIEFLSGNLLLRGGKKGQLEFIDCAQTDCELPPIIMNLHSYLIYTIQRIAKNIVVAASDDGYLRHSLCTSLFLLISILFEYYSLYTSFMSCEHLSK